MNTEDKNTENLDTNNEVEKNKNQEQSETDNTVEVTHQKSEEKETEKKSEDNKEDDNKTEKLEIELTESKDKYLRLYAEFENFRRRTNKEKADLVKNANENLLKNCIPIVDDFERALDSIKKGEELETDDAEILKKEISALKEGIDLVYNKLMKTLEQQGVKVMEPAKGKAFDIETQETITQIPAPSEDLKGKVIDEVEKGYFLNEKVLRFAKVVIGS